MAKRKQTDMVQGFDALRAARHAEKGGKKGGSGKEAAASTPKVAKGAPKGAPKVASRIGSTVMPSRTEIVCHACGHSFEIVGRSSNTVCPSCRERLPITDVVINEVWSDELVTSGKVTLGPDGVIEGGSLVTNQLILKGRVSGGSVRVSRTLEVHVGSELDLRVLSTRDLTLLEGCVLRFPREASSFRNVVLDGSGEGHLELEGCLTVGATGSFKGSVVSGGLCVEEGGGLVAAMQVDPAGDVEEVG